MSKTEHSGKPPEKIHGIAHVFAAAKYSMGGLKRLSGETAFRHEMLYGAAILAALVVFGAGMSQIGVAIALILLMFAIEAINTAIEEVVDHVSPEFSMAAKHAKDLGSFSVLCILLANGVYAALVILTLTLGV